ncbi:Cucumisin [Vitis vinifera]|uniref:Cucumisin n=1 Tax=Vitis vinifera TaxID=29760 RepID=A0A438JXE2_VITVI|nr:Cucumisin [Vitis vinifera]
MARQISPLCLLLLSLVYALLSSHSTSGAVSEADGVYCVHGRQAFWGYLSGYCSHQHAANKSSAEVHQRLQNDYACTKNTNLIFQWINAFSNIASDSLLYSYKRSFNGFVVKLTEEEMKELEGMDGVVSIFPNEKKKLHTTRSWDFIGFPQQVNRTSVESDVIIAVLDTGIWPESDSFKDKGFGPPPSKWKGICQGLSNFTCNNKIIGARYYRSYGEFSPEDLQTPRDSEGHGTHTASTAAGGLVSMASLLGFGLGTARAFDDAIADGVDIISLSVGGSTPKNYFADSIAIGAFHAMKKWDTNINFCCTIDRKFFTKVQLGDSKVYEGISINTFEPNGMYPFIYGGDAPNITGGFSANTSRNSLDPNLVKGKIVLCDIFSNGTGAFLAGAVGTVMADRGAKDSAWPFPLPASYLGAQDGSSIAYYVTSTSLLLIKGPNPATLDILKPDLAAPGVHILAAWPPISPISGVQGDTRAVLYTMQSGTSMACPHATGAAAYIKSFHPTWSPAAIKSALMTTALPMSAEKNPDAEFAYGAGQIDPLKSVNPGLVYDADKIDYVKFLCGQGYTTQTLQLVTGDNSVCSEATNGTVWDLNYPSFALSSSTFESITGVFTRTVTNVGSPVSTYKATVTGAPIGLQIQVVPDILSFTSLGQKLSFVLKVEGKVGDNIVSASLVWDDGVHQVRSPIVVFVVATN